MSAKNKIEVMAIKDAWFVVVIFGARQTSKVVKGWSALVDEVVMGFYGPNATASNRVAAMDFLTRANDWVPDFSGLPFNLIIQGDDGNAAEVFRIMEAANLEVKQ